ncbi:DUF397 domain-containing protein [Streptomyces sp. NRRL F-5135]|uniref:DUF397 domain-containing protein n=1 Tax=Streptomyces sp. NRRL F-5135 TaxID=1463858 RepID=UPI0004C8AFCC|nr:DUF397 domain-containing protein [Streptomyces sp. NRRL F-5135]
MNTNARTQAVQNLTDADWFKSSYSGNGTNCVEVATGIPTVVPVRDSKDTQGPALVFELSAFAAFVSAVRDHRFDSAN